MADKARSKGPSRRVPPRMRPLVLIISICLLLTACGKSSPIGPIDSRASLAVLSYEAIDKDTSGIVYRQINYFPAFLARTKVPVLLVFYQPMDPVNTQVIPRIEQLADQYRDKLSVVWIDAASETKLANDFLVDRLPQFTVVVQAAIKRSLVGYGEQGEQQLDQLIDAYLEQ